MPHRTKRLDPRVMEIVRISTAFLLDDEELVYRLPIHLNEFYATITIKPYMKYMIIINPNDITLEFIYYFIKDARTRKIHFKRCYKIYLSSSRY